MPYKDSYSPNKKDIFLRCPYCRSYKCDLNYLQSQEIMHCYSCQYSEINVINEKRKFFLLDELLLSVIDTDNNKDEGRHGK